MSDLVIVTVKVPRSYLEQLDTLVRLGRYRTRSEVIRESIRRLVMAELYGVKQ